MPLTIRPSTPDDLSAIAAIYAHAVLHGTASFETEAPSSEEMEKRREAVLAAGFSYFVAESGSKVVGYAYAGKYHARAAYRFTVENSIYIAPESQGKGVGKALLTRLIAECEALGMRQMMAVIGDSANAGSINLHKSMGFQHVGITKSVGFKHGRWLDVVLMQRALGDGDTSPPV